MKDIQQLAGAIHGMGVAGARAQGELMVLTCAIAALVRSHPDAEAFAVEFRRFWQLAGSQHSNDENGSPATEGIYSVLEVIEEASQVPLGVRPGH